MTQTGHPDDIVMLVHGIRTQAHWAEMVAKVIETELGARVQPVKYGFFDVVRFVLPFWTRLAPVRRIVREYRDLRLRYPQARISVIAHSFGTYALTKALEEPDVVFHRVILCGSIAPDDFRATRHRAQLGPDPILNDCGTHDVWPVIAKSITWGYGATGTFGFGAVGIRDRFSKFSHSTYFKRDFVRDYWIPFLKDGTIAGTEWEIDPRRTAPPYWQSLIASFPTRWVVVLLPLAALGMLVTALFSSDSARARVDQAYVGHWIGISHVYLRFSFENKSVYNTTFSVTRLELAPPGEGPRQVNFEGITNCNGSVPSDVRIVVEAGRTSLCDYSFLGNTWGMQDLYQKLSTHVAVRSLQNAPPDPTKAVLGGELLEELKSVARERLEWRPGEWRLTVHYQAADHPRAAEYVFTVADNTIETLRKQIDDYSTGFGVFPNWRYLSRTGQQPMQPVNLRMADR